MRLLYLFILVLLISRFDAFSQFGNKFYIAGGISSSEIIGDNWGRLPILERDTLKEDITGGGFTGSNAGFGLSLIMPLDKDENFRLPIGFDYYTYSGAQRVPVTKLLTYQLKHTVSVSVISLGIDYAILRVPLGEAKIYAGLHAKGTILGGDEYTAYAKYVDDTQSGVTKRSSKSDAFRIGAAAKITIEGQLYDPWFINIGGAVGIVNLLGKDDARGELFTPNIIKEDKESTVLNFYFTFMLQYRI